jgi:hypothetical protein
MNSKDWLEKRNNVRAAIFTKVTIKLIDNDIAHDLLLPKKPVSQATAREASGNDSPKKESSKKNSFIMPDFPFSSDNSMNPMFSYLIDSIFLLNDKLDKIIDLLEDNKGETKITVKETVNISGSGMKMILYDSIEKGQILNISLNIPGFPLSGFNTYGEVVRKKEIQKKDKPLYEIGVKFINILEKERDLLIAYAFSQERQQIRQLKKDIT